jgi:hypothetical protein
LYLYKDYNLGRHSFIKHEKSKKAVDVRTVIIDNFLKEKNLGDREIKFLKIDIEGYEYTALRGAVKTLSQTTNVLSEFSPAIMEQMNEKPMAFVDFMKGFGFQAFEIFGDSSLREIDFDNLMKHKEGVYNILWRKSKK